MRSSLAYRVRNSRKNFSAAGLVRSHEARAFEGMLPSGSQHGHPIRSEYLHPPPCTDGRKVMVGRSAAATAGLTSGSNALCIERTGRALILFSSQILRKLSKFVNS